MSGSSRPAVAASSAESARLARPIHSSSADPRDGSVCRVPVEQESSRARAPESGCASRDSVRSALRPSGRCSSLGSAVRPPSELVELLLGHPALESEGGDSLAVQPAGQVAQQRVARLGGDTADDQLVARDADDQPLAPLEQRTRAGGRSGQHPPRGADAQRVHRALVEDDRELDQEVGQVARERGYAHRRWTGRRTGAIRGFLEAQGSGSRPNLPTWCSPMEQVYGLLGTARKSLDA